VAELHHRILYLHEGAGDKNQTEAAWPLSSNVFGGEKHTEEGMLKKMHGPYFGQVVSAHDLGRFTRK
jgi:hypothetical protein